MSRSDVNSSPYRVIIVDDDETEREILVELLSAPHRQLEAFESAEAALEYLQDHPIDLAFLDHIMPGLSGAELAAQIKALYPQARIVMCTGYLVEVGYPHLREQAERVLHKPLNLGEVLQLAVAPAGA
ncbi:MAG: Response regulator receiver protein CpdR [Verrucomicrobiae bacterium]|nr:Response regulator receiver protein CpdR [Verrucomicrobiae bacterium]